MCSPAWRSGRGAKSSSGAAGTTAASPGWCGVTVSVGGGGYTTLSEEQGTDPDAPTASFLLELALEPELTHRGDWELYFLGLLCTAMGVAAIWFADALFRHNLRFLIRDPERAEPSEWELFSRKASWCFFTGLALFAYLAGLFL